MLTRNAGPLESDNFIGKPVPRENARRLSQGRGRYVDDIPFRNLAHVAFVRSPYAHSRIASNDVSAARALPGIAAPALA